MGKLKLYSADILTCQTGGSNNIITVALYFNNCFKSAIINVISSTGALLADKLKYVL